ncbi:hypothetical protein EYF80_031635 [Liparis tanakae]|uniref:Uncharacterized protein n=1 Tax=Liparis tanakae TaxID=230148 RepID=A0A4Z2GZN6_9TELE|nr:hypothetical protein EYF80_031635 [Liparis tanakae]
MRPSPGLGLPLTNSSCYQHFAEKQQEVRHSVQNRHPEETQGPGQNQPHRPRGAQRVRRRRKTHRTTFLISRKKASLAEVQKFFP